LLKLKVDCQKEPEALEILIPATDSKSIASTL
jgi:hypothetical protein